MRPDALVDFFTGKNVARGTVVVDDDEVCLGSPESLPAPRTALRRSTHSRAAKRTCSSRPSSAWRCMWKSTIVAIERRPDGVAKVPSWLIYAQPGEVPRGQARARRARRRRWAARARRNDAGGVGAASEPSRRRRAHCCFSAALNLSEKAGLLLAEDVAQRNLTPERRAALGQGAPGNSGQG